MAAPYDEKTASYVPRKLDPGWKKTTGPSAAGRFGAKLERLKSGSRSVRVQSIVSTDDSGGQGGYSFYASQNNGDGSVWAAHGAYNGANFNLPTPQGSYANLLYAPTTKADNGGCIEAGNKYENAFGSTTYQYFVADWCRITGYDQNNSPIPTYVYITLDSNFYNNYVATYSNGSGYPQYQQEIKVDGSGVWHLYIFNNLLQRYDDIYDSGGSSASLFGDRGWSLFETHYAGGATCQTLPAFSMSGLRVRVNGTWQYANISAGGFFLSSPDDCFQQSSPYYSMTSNSDLGWYVYSY